MPYITFKGRKIRLNLSYDRVLDCLDILQENTIDEYSKINLCIGLLAPQRKVKHFGVNDKLELYRKIVEERLTVINRPSLPGQSEKLFDFRRDFDLIYSSFMTAYKIDLIEQQGRLDWWGFISLFQGLPPQSKMREVMEIRGRKLPTPNGNNQDEIKQLQQLKQYWALPMDEGGYQDQLNRVFDTLKDMAGR